MSDIICDLVWNPVFPAGEIDLEREVIREEIALYQESPSDHITDLLENGDGLSRVLQDPINRRLWDMRVRLKLPWHAISDELQMHRSSLHDRLKKIIAEVPVLTPDEVRGLIE